MPTQAKVRKYSFSPLLLQMSQPKKAMANITKRLTFYLGMFANNLPTLFTQMHAVLEWRLDRAWIAQGIVQAVEPVENDSHTGQVQ